MKRSTPIPFLCLIFRLCIALEVEILHHLDLLIEVQRTLDRNLIMTEDNLVTLTQPPRCQHRCQRYLQRHHHLSLYLPLLLLLLLLRGLYRLRPMRREGLLLLHLPRGHTHTDNTHWHGLYVSGIHSGHGAETSNTKSQFTTYQDLGLPGYFRV